MKKYFFTKSDEKNIEIELRYFGRNNFVGRPIQGYHSNKCYLTIPAAEKLSLVQSRLAKFELGLKIFDGYRPQMAVDDFVTWSKTDKKKSILRSMVFPFSTFRFF